MLQMLTLLAELNTVEFHYHGEVNTLNFYLKERSFLELNL